MRLRNSSPGCQGRSKTRPVRRSKSRPVEHVGDRGLSGRRVSGAEAWAACKGARLGRSGRRPPPRGVFAAAGGGRGWRPAVGGSGVLLRASFPFALLEAIALAVHLQDMNMVGKSVQ